MVRVSLWPLTGPIGSVYKPEWFFNLQLRGAFCLSAALVSHQHQLSVAAYHTYSSSSLLLFTYLRCTQCLAQ